MRRAIINLRSPFVASIRYDEVTDDAATTAVIDDDSDNDESFWSSIELIVQALFAGLTFALVVILGALVIDRFARCSNDDDVRNK